MEKSRIVVTGVNGFVGEHLSRHLRDLDYAVHGIGRELQPNMKVATSLDMYSQCDLMNVDQVESLSLSSAKAIIHLAGLASVGESFVYPQRYMTGNGIMTDNILSTAAKQGFSGRVVVVSTGAIYSPKQPMPINEQGAIGQSSPYAVGKRFAEGVGEYYKTQGQDVVVARPFNHIGPGQGVGFLIPDLYSQITCSKEKNTQTILTGNLSTRRDYTDVRDIVRAYVMLATAESLEQSVYNISSGASYSGREILDSLLSAMDITNLKTEVDQSKVRPTDAQEIIGDHARISEELHWAPTISIDSTIKDFVEAHRSDLLDVA